LPSSSHKAQSLQKCVFPLARDFLTDKNQALLFSKLAQSALVHL
jgi:hypothetical protein